MKNLMIFIIFSFSILNLQSQTFENVFLGEDFSLYRGCYLKLKNYPTSDFEYQFYNDLKYCQSAIDINVIYPDIKKPYKSNKDSLKNRVFIVTDIIDKQGNHFDKQPYTNGPIFKLLDTTSNQTIFFKYNPLSESDFPFNVGNLKLDIQVFCSKIEKSVDDITDEVKYNSPFMYNQNKTSLVIYKYIIKAKPTYRLYLEANGNIPVIDGSEIIILFSDGTKLNKTNKVDVKVDSDGNGYIYSAFITLNQSDLSTLSNKKIKKFRLYVFDKEIKPFDAEIFQLFVRCIKETK